MDDDRWDRDGEDQIHMRFAQQGIRVIRHVGKIDLSQ